MRTVSYSAEPELRWHVGKGEWEVLEDFEVSWSAPDRDIYCNIFVLKGFRTDLASIPRAFRSIIPQVGRHIQPSIVHDWCYEGQGGLTRAEADLLFLDGMKAVGVRWLRRRAMYLAVRAFGWTLWD